MSRAGQRSITVAVVMASILGSAVGVRALAAGGSAPTFTALFAEGTVRRGFVEFLTLQNPGSLAATATVSFQASDDAGAPVAVAPVVVPLAGLSRATVNVSAYVASLGLL